MKIKPTGTGVFLLVLVLFVFFLLEVTVKLSEFYFFLNAFFPSPNMHATLNSIF